ncbi:hypothetical protein [Streptomyces niveus]|uniref:hypothetical protein n=1 Tax=Streptomyces niveus TaxID=193462 RepID=UPI0036D34876
MQFTGGLTTSFEVVAVRRSTTRKEYGGKLLHAHGPGARRVLLPAGYDRVEVTRVKPKPSSGTGFSRWRLRTVEAAELPALADSDTMSGRNEDLVYFDGHARVSYAWLGAAEHGELHFTSASGGTARRLTRQGDIRGEVTVPGSGFLAISTWGRWTLDRR